MINNFKNLKSRKLFASALIATFVFAFISMPVFADTDDYCSGTWSNSSSLSIQWFDSITNYFTSTSVGFWWNGSTNNVNVTTQRTGSTTDDGFDIRIYGSSSLSTWGSTQNYIKVLGVPIPSWSGTWSHSVITINTSDLMNQSPSLQKKVIAHEIGHSLGLDHPAPDSSHTDIKAIMKQGDNGYYTVQKHDSDNLKAKYN